MCDGCRSLRDGCLWLAENPVQQRANRRANQRECLDQTSPQIYRDTRPSGFFRVRVFSFVPLLHSSGRLKIRHTEEVIIHFRLVRIWVFCCFFFVFFQSAVYLQQHWKHFVPTHTEWPLLQGRRTTFSLTHKQPLWLMQFRITTNLTHPHFWQLGLC